MFKFIDRACAETRGEHPACCTLAGVKTVPPTYPRLKYTMEKDSFGSMTVLIAVTAARVQDG